MLVLTAQGDDGVASWLADTRDVSLLRAVVDVSALGRAAALVVTDDQASVRRLLEFTIVVASIHGLLGVLADAGSLAA